MSGTGATEARARRTRNPEGSPDPGLPSGFRVRLALASVASVPLIVSAAETYLANHPSTPASFHEAARLASEASAPIDDVRGSARYRKLMVRNLTEKALTIVWQVLKNKSSQ